MNLSKKRDKQPLNSGGHVRRLLSAAKLLPACDPDTPEKLGERSGMAQGWAIGGACWLAAWVRSPHWEVAQEHNFQIYTFTAFHLSSGHTASFYLPSTPASCPRPPRA